MALELIDKQLKDVQTVCEIGENMLEDPFGVLHYSALAIEATRDSVKCVAEEAK